MVKIDDDTYIAAVWFGENKVANIFALLTRVRDSEEWVLYLCIRFITDDKIFESDDREVAFKKKLGAGYEEQAVALAAALVESCPLIKCIQRYSVGGYGLPALQKAVGAEGWLHFAQVGPDGRPVRATQGGGAT